MNPQTALQIVAQLVALAPVPLANHQQGQEALKVLRDLVAPKPAASKIVEPKK